MPSNDCVDQCGQDNANSKTLGTMLIALTGVHIVLHYGRRTCMQ